MQITSYSIFIQWQFYIQKCTIKKVLKSLCRPEYQVSQPCECRNLFSMYAFLSKQLVEESKSLYKSLL
jgi:hypothetical protein